MPPPDDGVLRDEQLEALGDPLRAKRRAVRTCEHQPRVQTALITDGSRVALYSGYGADRDRLVAGQLADGRMQSTAQYRVVLPDGRKLPGDALIIGRGPDLYILTSTDWCRLDLRNVPAEP